MIILVIYFFFFKLIHGQYKCSVAYPGQIDTNHVISLSTGIYERMKKRNRNIRPMKGEKILVNPWIKPKFTSEKGGGHNCFVVWWFFRSLPKYENKI